MLLREATDALERVADVMRQLDHAEKAVEFISLAEALKKRETQPAAREPVLAPSDA